jgi:hypothetical protein
VAVLRCWGDGEAVIKVDAGHFALGLNQSAKLRRALTELVALGLGLVEHLVCPR